MITCNLILHFKIHNASFTIFDNHLFMRQRTLKKIKIEVVSKNGNLLRIIQKEYQPSGHKTSKSQKDVLKTSLRRRRRVKDVFRRLKDVFKTSFRRPVSTGKLDKAWQ